MNASRQFVVEERYELSLKLEKLSIFMNTDPFLALDITHQELLKRQSQVMRLYRDILDQRLMTWKME